MEIPLSDVKDGSVLFDLNFTQMAGVEQALRGLSTQYLWPRDQIINMERQYYAALADYNAFRISSIDGLTITARRRNPVNEDFTTQPYLSGLISTARKEALIIPPSSQWSGRISAFLRLPLGIGVWPAWWFNPEITGPWPQYGDGGPLAELDVIESLGEQGVFYSTVHSRGLGEVLQQDQFKHNCPEVDLGGTFNWFHVERTSTELRLGFNDYLYKVIPLPPDLEGPLHMNLNLAVGGVWPEMRGVPTEQQYQMHCRQIIATELVSDAPLIGEMVDQDATMPEATPQILTGNAPAQLVRTFEGVVGSGGFKEHPNRDLIINLQSLYLESLQGHEAAFRKRLEELL